MKKFMSMVLCATMLMSLGSVACFAKEDLAESQVCFMSSVETESVDPFADCYVPASEVELKAVGASFKDDVLNKVIVEGVSLLAKGVCLAVGTFIVRAIMNALKCDVTF